MSVIIAAYRAEDFLQRAVRSVHAQSQADVEIIVVDDASSDGTLDVARALANESGISTKIIQLETNGGPSVARNAALDVAQGDWVAVLDADDAFEPDHLTTLLTAGKDRAADVVLSNIAFFDPATDLLTDSGVAGTIDDRPITAASYVDRAQPLTGEADWGLLKPMFRRSFLDRAGIRYPVASRHGEDFLFMVEALLRGARVAITVPATYRYSQRNSGWSRTRIDYDAQIRDTSALVEDARVAANPLLVSAIKGRVSALEQWAAMLEVQRLRATRNLVGLAGAAIGHAPIRAELVKLARGKIAHWRDHAFFGTRSWATISARNSLFSGDI